MLGPRTTLLSNCNSACLKMVRKGNGGTRNVLNQHPGELEHHICMFWWSFIRCLGKGTAFKNYSTSACINTACKYMRLCEGVKYLSPNLGTHFHCWRMTQVEKCSSVLHKGFTANKDSFHRKEKLVMRKSKLRTSWFETNFAFKTYYNICLLPVSVPQGQVLLRGSQAFCTPPDTVFGNG